MDNNPKAQVIERLKEAQNVLITVSNNPSVDQLSAAIGLTVMLNKLDKHATAVFSGAVPSTIEFLKPEDTLEQTTDSLRDFIISLDKSKADKLRYKVEESVVKIFITPYKTSLSEQDLNFSQGDFNVDVVVALGVDQRDHIDQAIINHGRILHDATVIGIMAGQAPVDVGGINWQDANASSLCEMLVSISESFKSGLLDSQMATAFLTGIVAETDRFSNDKTSPKVMTMSAQLMAAGANQQLIATELAVPEAVEPEMEIPEDLPAVDTSDIDEESELVLPEQNNEEGVISLHSEHMMPVSQQPGPAYYGPANEDNSDPAHQIHIDDEGTLRHKEDMVDELTQAVNAVQANSSQKALSHERVIQPLPDEPEQESIVEQAANYGGYVSEPPKLGGTLTASGNDNQDEPAIDPLGEIPQSVFPAPELPPSAMPSTQSPLVSVQDDAESVAPQTVPTTESPQLVSDGETDTTKPLGPAITPDETLADIEKSVEDYTGNEVHGSTAAMPDTEAARQAVLDAMNATAYDANRPEPIQSLNAMPLSDQIPGLVTDIQDDTSTDTPPPIVPPPFPLPPTDNNQ